MKKNLSVIITVFSETYSLIQTVDRLLKNDTGYIKEIILIVHPDSSRQCIRTCQNLSVDRKNVSFYFQKKTPGVGNAIRQGMNAANCEYITLLSADLETEPEAVHRMMEKIWETGCDVVIGNRWIKGGGFYRYDKKKLVLNWLFQKIFQLLFLTRISDLTYGFKLMTQNVAQNIHWDGTLHEIYVETTLRPLKQKYRVEQIPTVWIGRSEGNSKNTFLKNFRYVSIALKILMGH